MFLNMLDTGVLSLGCLGSFESPWTNGGEKHSQSFYPFFDNIFDYWAQALYLMVSLVL